MEHLSHQPLDLTIVDLETIQGGEVARPLLDSRWPLPAGLREVSA